MRSLFFLYLCVATTWAYDWTCSLFCYNGGKCRHGKGEFGSYTGVEETDVMPWEHQEHVNGMYCSCPIGYTGLQCEIALVVCNEENGLESHTCFNGSTCKKQRTGTGRVYWRCECDVAHSVMDANYAGRYCEHIATTFCNHNVESSTFGGTSSYCTNGGKCRKREYPGQEHPGCDCTDEYFGDHCEYTKKSADNETALMKLTSERTTILLIGIIVPLVLLCTCFFYCRDKKQKKVLKKKRRTEGVGSENFQPSNNAEYA